MPNINLERIKKEKPIKELLEFCIFNIDKPAGPTSFYVDTIVRRMLNAGKTSHFGTLDPQVTGVLPIALNRACRLLGWFMKKDKTYVGIMRVHKKIGRKKLEEEIKNFIGKIKQTPPVKSRVKRVEREREIYYWKIIEIETSEEEEEKGMNVLFEVKCEAGTYIRKLISDLGEKIGGAHMLELRRTEAGIFKEADKNFVNLYELEKAVEEWKKGNEEKIREILIPGEIISEILPVVFVEKQVLKSLYTGRSLAVNQTDKEKFNINEEFCAFLESQFIGVYKAISETLAKPEFVFN